MVLRHEAKRSYFGHADRISGMQVHWSIVVCPGGSSLRLSVSFEGVFGGQVFAAARDLFSRTNQSHFAGGPGRGRPDCVDFD